MERLHQNGLDAEIDDYYRKLIHSEAGRGLTKMAPRYAYWAFEDTGKFIQYLGPDVYPLTHGPYQAREVALPMIEAQRNSDRWQFTPEEEKLLVITHVLHDAHEYKTGDVAVPDKTRESDLAELAVSRQVLEQTLDGDPLGNDVHKLMSDLDGSTFLGRAFKCGELIGYLKTGLRAYSLRDHPDLSEAERAAMLDMGRVVSESNANKLLNYHSEFAYVGHVLAQYEREMFYL